MSNKPKDITCKKENCFAYHKGVCQILTDTHFKKGCPFYKPKKSIVNYSSSCDIV